MRNGRVHTGHEGGTALQRELLGGSSSRCWGGRLTPRGVTAVTSGVTSPTETQLLVPARGVTGLAEVGSPAGEGLLHRQPGKRLAGGIFSESNHLEGNNGQLAVEVVMVTYRLVRKRGKCLTG